MRGRTVLILLILVVGLVAFIELYEHDIPSSEERTALAKRVLNLDAEEVVALDWSWDSERVRLERRSALEEQPDAVDWAATSWALTEPLPARADPGLVTMLIESLVGLEKKRSLEEADRAGLGLDPPRLVVRLTTHSRQLELQIGSEVPAGGSMVVATDDGISVVEDLVWSELTRKPGDWRHRQVFEFAPPAVARIDVATADETVSLAKRDSRFWLTAPLQDLADADRVESLLAELASMTVDAFADELGGGVSVAGLDPPVGVIELTIGEGDDSERLAWGREVAGAAGAHFARSGSQVFTTDAALEPFFAMSTDEWRSLALTSFETFEIDALRVRQGDEPELYLVRDGAAWTRGEDEVAFPPVSELLYAIVDSRAASVARRSRTEPTAIEAAEPALVIELSGEKGDETVTLYGRSSGGARAVVGGREVVLYLADNEFTEILAKLAEVRSLQSVKNLGVEQLSIDGPDLSPDP